jgi:hypothetical protein
VAQLFSLGGLPHNNMTTPIYVGIAIFAATVYFSVKNRPSATTKSKPKPLPDSGKPKPPQALLMALTQNEQKLVSGDRDSVFDFADSEECVVVDHRSEEEPIFEDVAARLPAGYFQFEFIDEKIFRVTCGGRTGQLELKYNPEDRYLACLTPIKPDRSIKKKHTRRKSFFFRFFRPTRETPRLNFNL